MARRQLPPIHRLLGIIDDSQSLPLKAAVGDSWYEESAGILWIWDDEHSKWVDLGRLHRASPGLIASLGEAFGFGGATTEETVAGARGARGATGASGGKGDRGAQGERGPAGPAGRDGVDGKPGPAGAPGPAGKDGAPGRNGVDGKDGAPGRNGLDG